MSPINSFFTKIFCINLDRRPERWERSQTEFAKHGLTVERFAAIDGKDIQAVTNGKQRINGAEIGCSLSHKRILEMIVENGWEQVLIHEDDVEFVENFNERFEEAIKHVPPTWEILYLGGNLVVQPSRLTNSSARTPGRSRQVTTPLH